MNDGYYEGGGLNISQAVHGELRGMSLANEFGGDIRRAAMSGAAAQQGVVNEVQRLQDYQAGADAMRQLRERRSAYEQKLKAGLAAAPGTKQSLLDASGEVDKEKVEALAQQAQDEVDQIRPRFWSPERLARYEQEYADFESETRRHVAGMVQQHQLAGIRRAGVAALEEAERLGSVKGYQTELKNQVDAGILTETEARVKLMDFNKAQHDKAQDEGHKVLMGMAVSDPEAVLRGVARGEYADMDPVYLERAYATAQRVNAQRVQQEEFTAEERAKMEAGEVVKPRFKVRNGATEQEYRWREHYHKEGTYGRYFGEIRQSFDEEVLNCPVPDSKESADEWVSYMVKKWADPSTGYGLDEHTVRVRCGMAQRAWLGTVEGEDELQFDMERFLGSLTDAQIVPWAEGQVRYRTAEFAEDKELIEEATKTMTERKAKVLHDARNATARYMAGNPKASYSKCFEKCLEFLTEATKRYDEELDYNVSWSWDDGTEEKKFEESAREAAENQRADIEAADGEPVYTKEKQPSGVEAQAAAYAEYAGRQRPMVVMEREKKAPERVYRIGRVTADEEALYVNQKRYDALVKKFGKNPMAHVTLPGSRAYAPLPVKAAEVDGVALSDMAMVRLNNIQAKQASVRFAAGEEPEKKKATQEEAGGEMPEGSLPVPGEPDDALVPLGENSLFPEE